MGQLRNAKRAARAQIASSEWALRGVRLSLAAEVATTYFTLLEYERDLAIARRSCTLRRESATACRTAWRWSRHAAWSTRPRRTSRNTNVP